MAVGVIFEAVSIWTASFYFIIFIFPLIMHKFKILLICFSVLNIEARIEKRSNGKVRRLFFSNMADRVDNDFNPTNPVGLLRCGERAGHLDCLVACSRNPLCISVTYIPKARLCLLSWSDTAVRVMKNPARDFFGTTFYHVHLEGQRSHRFASRIDHGKAPESCGATAQNLNPLLERNKRIINGYTPVPYNMPWMGALTQNSQTICSAILLSKYDEDKSSLWAMVASHCLFKEADEQALDEKEIDFSKFGLLFGVHDLRLATPHLKYRTIQKVHRNFEPSDISLVKMNSPVKFDAYINGLCFPDIAEEQDVAEFYMCLTCGWGATKLPAPETVPTASNELQCIEVKVEQEKPSHMRRKSLMTIQWQDTNLQGPYKGDSGSPLFCRLFHEPRKFLYGIVTNGATFTVGGTTNFERIPSHTEWINQIMDRNTAEDVDRPQRPKCCFSVKFNSKVAGMRQSASTMF